MEIFFIVLMFIFTILNLWRITGKYPFWSAVGATCTITAMILWIQALVMNNV